MLTRNSVSAAALQTGPESTCLIGLTVYRKSLVLALIQRAVNSRSTSCVSRPHSWWALQDYHTSLSVFLPSLKCAMRASVPAGPCSLLQSSTLLHQPSPVSRG